MRDVGGSLFRRVGWEKALGDAGELSWWEARVAAAARQHIA